MLTQGKCFKKIVLMDDFYFYFLKLTLKQQQKGTAPTAASGYILECVLQQTHIPLTTIFSEYKNNKELQYFFCFLSNEMQFKKY